MKNKQNLLKKINSIAIGFGLICFPTFTDLVKAETPQKCITAIGSKVDGKYTKTPAEIGDDMTFCTDTPDRFVITIYELGLCTAQPIQTADARVYSGDEIFSREDCVVTMTSDGVTTDLANNTVDLPQMEGRPPSNSYRYAYIILTNTFGLRGSVTLKNDAGEDVKYCSVNTEFANSSGATIEGNFCTPENHTEILNTFDEEFSPFFPEEAIDGGGKVTALLTADDEDLTTATSEGAAKRLIGVFETNSGSPVVINNGTNGLEMQLNVTDIGYGIQFDNGEPTNFGSMPFKPVFATF